MSSNLTPRDVEILCMICQSMKAKPDIDMEKFAALGGFTKASASVIAPRTFKKAMANGSGVAETPQTGGKGGGRKRKAVAMADGAEGDDAEETPSKTKKGRKAKPATENEGDGEEDGDEIAVKREKQEDEGEDELA